MGLVRIAAAAGASALLWLSRLPLGCGAWLLARARALDALARPPSADG
ncbi:hypothetical protein [Methylobacterium sp.]|nr:hypothetical protein [Methylobacterium sp.]MBY0259578.1 hypothetical protein [Methylobacterium sp.]